MFKALMGLAMAAPALAADTLNKITDDLAETQCQLLTSTSGTIFSILDIEGSDDYSVNVSGDNKSGTNLVFNYCTYVDGTTDTYAVYRTLADKSKDVAIATKSIPALSATNIRDSDDKTTGIEFSQGSSTVCKTGTNYSMTTRITCDKDQAGGKVTKVEKDDCEFIVLMSSSEGCPDVNIDVDKYMGWLEENEWVIGIIYCVVGPLIAFFGTQMFPIVCAILIAVFVLGLIVSISLAFGWMVTTGGCIAVLCVGAVCGILAGVLIKRHIWLMVALLGAIGGFFGGALIFSLVCAASGWNAVWGWWVFTIVFAMIGMFAAYKLGAPVVLLTTSFVGSYLFMRSWTLFFPGHYPSEAEIMSNPEELDVDGIFWVFIGVFAVSFVASTCVQVKRGQVHEDLDDYGKA
jgi:hypothetical protein